MEDARGDAYVANHGGSKFDKAPSLAVGRKKKHGSATARDRHWRARVAWMMGWWDDLGADTSCSDFLMLILSV